MNLKALSFASLFILAVLYSCGQKGKQEVKLKNQADSVAYSIGTAIGSNMKKDGLDSINLDVLMKGLKAALHGDSLALDQTQSQSVIQTYLSEKQKAKGDANLAAGKKFLDENKKKEGVKETPDGLQYMVVKEGTGPMPATSDTVTVHYHGTLTDGTVFDSSVERGEPTTYPLMGFVKGWQEALQMMKVGSKWRLFLPPSLGYGDRQAGPKIPPNSVLVFDLELIGIKGK